MTDVNGVDETQLLDYRKSVGGVSVHVVAVRGLGRPAMAAAIVRDHAISLSEEEHHLAVPVIGAQRPAMMEEQRLGVLRAPVLVEDLGAVGGRNRRHCRFPLV